MDILGRNTLNRLPNFLKAFGVRFSGKQISIMSTRAVLNNLPRNLPHAKQQAAFFPAASANTLKTQKAALFQLRRSITSVVAARRRPGNLRTLPAQAFQTRIPGRRSLFIQTENTPNADVSQKPFDEWNIADLYRH